MIPIFCLQRDEKYYPNPLKFDPSRFIGENKKGKTRIDQPYYPFGEGPRSCIAMHLGKVSAKIGLASVLQKHSVDIDDRHFGKEIDQSPHTFFNESADGIHLKFKVRQQSESKFELF